MTKLRIIIAAIVVSALLPAASFAISIPNTGGIPGLSGAATYNGAVYVFFSYYGSTDKFYVSSYGSTWSPRATVPIPASLAPNAVGLSPVEFNGRLYLFFEDTSTGDFYYMSMDSYGVWDTIASKVPGGANGSWFHAVVYNGSLYAMWRAGGNNTSLFYSTLGTNGLWSATAHLSTGESYRGPTGAVLHALDGVDYLYAFWKDIHYTDPDQMWYASKTATTSWSSSTRLNTPDYPLTSEQPSAASSGPRIYLTYKGGYNGDILVKRFTDSRTWMDEETVLGNVTNTAPSAVWFNGALWIFYASNDVNTNFDIEYFIYNG